MRTLPASESSITLPVLISIPPPTEAGESARGTESRDDRFLLDAWVGRGDHAAFRALVAKYTALVYGTALRKLRRVEWAEEVVQEVFVVFARKAGSLRGEGGLTGWLHRTAVLRSAARLRAELRHSAKLRKLAQEENDDRPSRAVDAAQNGNFTSAGADLERDWGRLRPLLDDALASLPETDRRVILLHYFGQKTYAEIGTVTGLTHDAARKRGLRALEKLGRQLRRRGAVLPVTAVGGALAMAFDPLRSAAGVNAAGVSAAAGAGAPVHLAPLAAKAASMGIAATALSGIGGGLPAFLSLSSLFAMKSTAATLASAAVLVVAAGSAGVWWGGTHAVPPAISVEPQAEVKSAQAAPGSAVMAVSSQPGGRKPGGRAATGTMAPGPAVPPVPNGIGAVSKRPPPDPAMKEAFNQFPRTKVAEARITALKSGFKQLLDQQLVPTGVKTKLIAEARRRLKDPELSPAEKGAIEKDLATLEADQKDLREKVDSFRTESEIWLQSEAMIERDSILDEMMKTGGASALPPPPEPETPQAINFPEYRAATDLMKTEQYGEALTAFTRMANESTGDLRDQSRWHAVLCGLITGNAEAVETASLPLLRSTPSYACFAMAAKAIQRDAWGDAQIWVTQAFNSGDATQTAMFQDALTELGWAHEKTNQLIPPPKP